MTRKQLLKSALKNSCLIIEDVILFFWETCSSLFTFSVFIVSYYVSIMIKNAGLINEEVCALLIVFLFVGVIERYFHPAWKYREHKRRKRGPD